MTTVTTLVELPLFQALGWSLLHFIWQGLLVAILLLAARFLLRELRSPSTLSPSLCGDVADVDSSPIHCLAPEHLFASCAGARDSDCDSPAARV